MDTVKIGCLVEKIMLHLQYCFLGLYSGEKMEINNSSSYNCLKYILPEYLHYQSSCFKVKTV